VRYAWAASVERASAFLQTASSPPHKSPPTQKKCRSPSRPWIEPSTKSAAPPDRRPNLQPASCRTLPPGYNYIHVRQLKVSHCIVRNFFGRSVPRVSQGYTKHPPGVRSRQQRRDRDDACCKPKPRRSQADWAPDHYRSLEGSPEPRHQRPRAPVGRRRQVSPGPQVSGPEYPNEIDGEASSGKNLRTARPPRWPPSRFCNAGLLRCQSPAPP
jgi:hypothetical protein